jgi:purine-binding chemotaxis protein CheW
MTQPSASTASAASANGAPGGAGAATKKTTYLQLRLGSERYALLSSYVREVARWYAPTPVPGAPPMLPGIINHRGVVLPVVNLCHLLGLPNIQPGRATRYLVSQYEDIDLALLVDAVIDLVDVAESEMEALPATLPPQQARLLYALCRVDDMPVSVLNLAEVIAAVRSGG